MSLLTKRYADKISNVLSCYDRILIQGTLLGLCYAKGKPDYLNFNHIRIFDYPRWAEPLREQIRENTERLATQNSVKIEFLRSHQTRKEEVVEKVLKQRGLQTGLVHILSAMESCQTYKPFKKKGISFTLRDNAFTEIADWETAQTLPRQFRSGQFASTPRPTGCHLLPSR